MPKTRKEGLIWTLQVVRRELDRPPPSKTRADKERYEQDRIKHVGLFNQYLGQARTLGLAVADDEWPQPFEDTGFGGSTQFLCTWDEVAHRNHELLQLLESAADPDKPSTSEGSSAPSDLPEIPSFRYHGSMLKISIVTDPASLDQVVARVRKALSTRAYEVKRNAGKEFSSPGQLQVGHAFRPRTEADLDPERGRFRLEQHARAVDLHWRNIPDLREIVRTALLDLKHHLIESPEQIEADDLYRQAAVTDHGSAKRRQVIGRLRELGYEQWAKELEEPEPSDGSSAKPEGKV